MGGSNALKWGLAEMVLWSVCGCSRYSVFFAVQFCELWGKKWQGTYPPDPILQFLDKYVSHAVGNHYFLQWSKSNRRKIFLDKVTASDIAYTILVYENTKEIWEEDLQIKASYKTDEERRNAMHHKNPSIM